MWTRIGAAALVGALGLCSTTQAFFLPPGTVPALPLSSLSPSTSPRLWGIHTVGPVLQPSRKALVSSISSALLPAPAALLFHWQRLAASSSSSSSSSSSHSSYYSSGSGGGGFYDGGALWASILEPEVQAGPTARVTYKGPTDVSVGDQVTIVYRPPFDEVDVDEPLLFMGGFNGWDGEEQPLVLPALPQPDGTFEVTVIIPNFAKVVDFIFSDGVRYDTNDGEYYHLRVRLVQQEGKDGSVRMFRQEDDGTLTPTGEVVQAADPQELERLIDEEMVKRAAKGAEEVNEGVAVMLTKEDQRRVQKLRAEASLVGEQLGLGKIMVNEARDLFDRYDDDLTATLAREDVGMVLDKLGFPMDEQQVQALVQRHAKAGAQYYHGSSNHVEEKEEGRVDLFTFMHIFHELDSDDVGISIV